MAVREIAKHDWREFLHAFSRQHEGWLVRLEVRGPEATDRPSIADRRLLGVIADRAPGGGDEIDILVGEPGDPSKFRVFDPVHLWLLETPEGAHEALEIESDGGDIASLRFRATVLPETVDGI